MNHVLVWKRSPVEIPIVQLLADDRNAARSMDESTLNGPEAAALQMSPSGSCSQVVEVNEYPVDFDIHQVFSVGR